MRHSLRTAVLGVLLWALSPSVPAQPQDLPLVRVVATGGTISNRAGGRLTAAQLVDAVPAIPQYARIETEQFANASSLSLTLDQWLSLARRLNGLFEGSGNLAGIVVTSGTDTLEDLAYFLHLTVRTSRPVVVVGSMRNPDAVGYDGAANLLQAVRVAAEPAAAGKGVLVVLNGEIHSAREVTKADTRALDAFETPDFGLLGVVDSDRVAFYRAPTRRHTAASEFDAAAIGKLPRVDILTAYQDAPGDLVAAAVKAGARGLVLASAGAGSITTAQRAALEDAAERGVVYVLSSRTNSGRIGASPAPRSASRTRLRIAGDNLSPIKARVLLMLALTKTGDPEEIQRMFDEY